MFKYYILLLEFKSCFCKLQNDDKGQKKFCQQKVFFWHSVTMREIGIKPKRKWSLDPFEKEKKSFQQKMESYPKNCPFCYDE
jgi:hypothetical protein